ncbi:DUF6286 domain-containing protein [Streptomyces sp. NPDC048606]|uniref:DUF6286 domain-containing protein n=1 Tax=Streptomyces sp. NPDC048606 TaxID=3154726 RepID=UPI0034144BA6
MTTVADRVAAKIARQAAAESLTGGDGRVLRGTAHGAATGPASTRNRGFEVAVDLALPLTEAVDARAGRVQEHVRARTEHLTGRQVGVPLVRVKRLAPAQAAPVGPVGPVGPGAPAVPVGPAVPLGRGAPAGGRALAVPVGLPVPAGPPDPSAPACPPVPACPPAPAGRRAPRAWSRRGVSAGCLAVAVTAASGLLLGRVLAPRLPVDPAAWFPYEALLGHLRDPGLRGAAAAGCALLGLWLVALALTPGRRRMLTLDTVPTVRAVLGRADAARLVRAALAGQPALRVCSVRCTARTVRVRAELAFGGGGGAAATPDADADADAEAVREAAYRAVVGAVAAMAPVRSPRVTLALRAASGGGPAAPRRDGGSDA